ncbi:MAG: hypothetical protein H6923_11120 [Alphaproteobacteria bacterium]|nr:hypothetical protein [Alphaproteobacteria bacterium]
MKATWRWTLPAVVPVLLAVGLAACDSEGPAEKAGEQIDETFKKSGDLSDGPFEKAGEDLDEAAEDVKKSVDQPSGN